ncbi:hypothetical protein [Pontimicrobium sp. MEBiC06410]
MRYITTLLITIATLVCNDLFSQTNEAYTTEKLELLKTQIKDSIYKYKYSNAIKNSHKLIK